MVKAKVEAKVEKKETKKEVKRVAKPTAPVIGAVGRRKQAVARVWVRRGQGGVAVNEKRCVDYFNTDAARMSAIKPLIVCDVLANYDVVANVSGGGNCAQADAVKLGIARALLKENESLRAVLRQHGLLTRS